MFEMFSNLFDRVPFIKGLAGLVSMAFLVWMGLLVINTVLAGVSLGPIAPVLFGYSLANFWSALSFGVVIAFVGATWAYGKEHLFN